MHTLITSLILRSPVSLFPPILLNRGVSYPLYFVRRRDLLPFVSDLQLSLAAPFLGFVSIMVPSALDYVLKRLSPQWVFCAFFRMLDISAWAWLNKYRVHEPEEITKLNRATVSEVVRAVFTEQILQTIAGLWWLGGRSDSEDATLVNHTRVMSSWAPFVFKLLQAVLGSRLATPAIHGFGVQLIWWWYWYIVPIFQMLAAL